MFKIGIPLRSKLIDFGEKKFRCAQEIKIGVRSFFMRNNLWSRWRLARICLQGKATGPCGSFVFSPLGIFRLDSVIHF